MLNIEKYKDIVLESLKPCKLKAGLYREGAKIVACKDVSCTDCKERLFKWLTEEYKEPVLDETEKTYLSAIIKPFKANVTDICKLSGDIGFYYIRIYAESLSSELSEEVIDLPLFEIGTMYKGMRLGKHYSLEELGL